MSSLTTEQIVENLRTIRASATDAQITEGRAWYPAMGKLIREIARESFHVTGERVSDSFAPDYYRNIDR